MKKKLLSTLLLAGTLLIGSTVSAYAQDVSSDPLQPYEDRLEELSTELGTDLAIVAPEDGTIEDAIDFYSSMSMDEFDSYVKDAYEEAESLDVVTEEYVSEESSSLDVAPLASIAYYQKYFYNSGNTNNYLYVRAYVNSDTSKYTGGILMCLPRAAYGKYHTFHTGSRQNLPAGQKWKLHARHLKNRYP